MQGRLCLPLCGAVGRQFGRQCRRHSVLTDVGRIVAVPKAVLRTRALFHALRRIVRRHFFSPEDEIGRAIDRAFAELAREARK